MPGRSAAYIVSIVAVTAFISGALTLTVVDPVVQTIMDSPQWSSSTAQGTDLLRWMADLWAFMSTAILIGLLSDIWVRTRQPT
jgi:hypothetical protein